MSLTKNIIFICLTYLLSCKEKQSNNTEIIANNFQIDSSKLQTYKPTEQIPLQLNEIIKIFPILKLANKFNHYDELPDSLYQLKNNEVQALKLNDKYPAENTQYISWYAFGKTESKNYFTVYLFQTIESVCLYQANYSKKDSSLIQLFLLSEWSNPCEETSSTETNKIENKYIQKTINEYEEWNENGKDGKGFVETITTIFLLSETGKIDSLSSSRTVIIKKLK